MKLKKGVLLGDIKPEIIMALLVIEPILQGYNQGLVITSCRNGKHSKNSKHYLGYAVDFRIWQLQNDNTTDAVVALIRSELTKEYYVKAEDTHIHVQWNGQPIG